VTELRKLKKSVETNTRNTTDDFINFN